MMRNGKEVLNAREKRVLNDLRSKAMYGQAALGCAVLFAVISVFALAILSGRFGLLLIAPAVLLNMVVVLGTAHLYGTGKYAARELKYLS